MNTPMTKAILADPERSQRWTTVTPLGRRDVSEEVAYGVLLLASYELSFKTGSELVVDRGWIAQ